MSLNFLHLSTIDFQSELEKSGVDGPRTSRVYICLEDGEYRAFPSLRLIFFLLPKFSKVSLDNSAKEIIIEQV